MAYLPSKHDAFDKVSDVRAALMKGRALLKEEARKNPADSIWLLFCASCLCDLDSALSEATLPDKTAPDGTRKAGIGRDC